MKNQGSFKKCKRLLWWTRSRSSLRGLCGGWVHTDNPPAFLASPWARKNQFRDLLVEKDKIPFVHTSLNDLVEKLHQHRHDLVVQITALRSPLRQPRDDRDGYVLDTLLERRTDRFLSQPVHDDVVRLVTMSLEIAQRPNAEPTELLIHLFVQFLPQTLPLRRLPASHFSCLLSIPLFTYEELP